MNDAGKEADSIRHLRCSFIFSWWGGVWQGRGLEHILEEKGGKIFNLSKKVGEVCEEIQSIENFDSVLAIFTILAP